MRKWKLIVLSLVTSLSFVVLPVASTSAFPVFGGSCGASETSGGAGGGAVCSNSSSGDPLTGPNGIIGKVTKDIALFAGVTAVIIIIIGGFMYVLSNGDAGKVSRAKDTILYAAVGLVVIALGQAIIIFVIDRV